MKIVSHRGFWIAPEEKNTEIAFRRSFAEGFGTETDIRDHQGRLCISHDMPAGDPMPLEHFFDIFVEYDSSLPLFLNIKSDGIGGALRSALDAYSIKNYFAFDMSVPEMVQFKKRELLKFMTRMSDVETVPFMIEDAQGIWVDDFFDQAVSPGQINQYASEAHSLCFVSPELHGRAHEGYWGHLKEWESESAFRSQELILCTDLPRDAVKFFEGEGSV